jgi:hypothetical protein
MRKVFISFLLIAATFSCIDPIDLKIDDPAGTLVVDGIITSEPGPYTIKIGRSIPFDNTQALGAYFKPEKGAILSIASDDGNEYALTEGKPGYYQTPVGFTGQTGKSYVLHIQTTDGIQYQSTSERLNPVPEIDTILYEYIVYPRLIKNSVGDQIEQNATGFKIQVEAHDPPENNFYRWEATGIFEFFSITDRPDIKQCWAPHGRIEGTVVVDDDQHFQGNLFRHEIGIIPYDRPTYFLIDLKQYSLSEEAFEFWQRVQNQQKNTGSIFDPAPAPIVGNVFRTDDPEDRALGFFGASSVFTQKCLINRFPASGLVSPTPYIEPIPGDCRDDYPGATNIKPPGFK